MTARLNAPHMDVPTQSAIERYVRAATSELVTGLGNYANDAAAAAGGVAIGGVYRNGSVLMVRVA